MGGYRIIPSRYIVSAVAEFVVAPGGLCYPKEAVRAAFRNKIICPECNKDFNERWMYEHHFFGVHLNGIDA